MAKLKTTLNHTLWLLGFSAMLQHLGKEIFDAGRESQELGGLIYMVVKCGGKNTGFWGRSPSWNPLSATW